MILTCQYILVSTVVGKVPTGVGALRHEGEVTGPRLDRLASKGRMMRLAGIPGCRRGRGRSRKIDVNPLVPLSCDVNERTIDSRKGALPVSDEEAFREALEHGRAFRQADRPADDPGEPA
jgi:hypothetical protein